MSYTRALIIDEVMSNIGRTSTYAVAQAVSLNKYCNDALKIAVHAHPFRDTVSIATLNLVSGSATAFDMLRGTVGNVINVVGARIITNGVRGKLKFKGAAWWMDRVVDETLNDEGIPKYAIRRKTVTSETIVVDRPVVAGSTMRICYSVEPVFTSDSTENPIPGLDVFITQYVTAQAFLRLENVDMYVQFKRSALGFQYDEGKIGGSLKHAIDADMYDIADDVDAEAPEGPVNDVTPNGVSILDLTTGVTKTWY